MSDLHAVLTAHVGEGAAPGAVAVVAQGDRAEWATVGHADADGAVPVARDTLFRIASLTKPVTAAATMMLVEDGRIALDAPVARWLPELASPAVVREPSGPLHDVVPAERPITVADLLTFRAGYGFAGNVSAPAVRPLFEVLKQGIRPQQVPPPEEWLTMLSRLPMLHQPGEAWLYNTCSDILGVLVARASGLAFPEFLAERIFEPLGMADTGFHVPVRKRARFTSSYRRTARSVELSDPRDGQWSTPPAFPSGAGGLVSTADDYLAFARMLLAEGTAPDGRRLLRPESVRQMTTDHLTAAQRRASSLFLDGQGWGFGGSVDVGAREPWHVPGRYGWIGATGTTAHLVPSTGRIAVFLSQLELTGPVPSPALRDFWRYAATA